MAITRTQIAKQLLEKGGRVGLKNGPAGGASAGGNYGGTRNPEQTYGGGDRNPGLEANIDRFAAAEANRELAEEIKSKKTLKDLASDYIKDRQKLGYNLSLMGIPGQTKRSSTLQKAFLKSLIDQGKTPPATLTGEKQDLAKFFVEDAFKNDDYGNFLMDEYGLPAVLMRGNVGGLYDTGGDGSSSSILLPETMTAQAPSNTEQEPEIDEDEGVNLSRRFAAKGGRAGFRFGSEGYQGGATNQGGAGRGTDVERPGGGDGPKGPSTTGDGGGVTSIIKEKPPVNIVKEKSNVQKIMDIFGLSDDNDPKSVSLGTGLAEQAKQDIIKDKEIKAQGMSEAEAELRAQGLLAIGGRVGLMEGGMPYEGGIMDLESARQMYGLGKLVKKVTRSVKKIAKSPLGKAALLSVGAFGLPGGAFGMKGFLPQAFKTGASKFLFGLPGGNKLVDPTKGLFGVGGKLALGKGKLGIGSLIGGASLVSGLLTAEQEEEAQQIADETGIDIAEIRANPDKYLGRRFRAEGGSMKEPVAKKTMPLLDMDGQEMDFRAEGGFVPIGRMEKADDVPARLSKNEFVFTADAVRNAGDGSVDKGAEVMYNMMKNLEAGGDVSEESQGLEGARKMFQTSQRLEEVL